MEIIGFILTLFIGLLIGLLGGGGSILTVPILVYLLAIPATLSTTYSLALVSISSILAAAPHLMRRELSFKKILLLGVPSVLSLYWIRAYALPAIPKYFVLFGISIEKNMAMMVFFSMLMLLAGAYMIRPKKNESSCVDCPYSKLGLMIAGLFEGAITGLVGAGGGFIIVPILMVFGKMNPKQAVVNSLFLIGVKSMIGFLVSHNLMELDLVLLGKLLLIVLIGMYFGRKLHQKIEAQRLKTIFGYFVLGMGFFILLKEWMAIN